MEQKERTIVYPLGPRRLVVIDSAIQFDAPTIKGTRIPTACLYGMFTAGEPLANIASWYEISTDAVLDAVQYEVMRRCKVGRKAIKKAMASE